MQAILGPLLVLGSIAVLGGCDEPTRTPPVEAVEIAAPWPYVNVGDTLMLEVKILDTEGKPLPGDAVTWSTSDATVATVSGGVVTGVKEGVATIAAEAGGKRDEVQVTVEFRPTSVHVVGLSSILAPGAAIELQASPANHSIRWSSSDSTVAKVSDSGRVQAVGPGEAVIVARAGSVRGEYPVEVVRPYTLTTFGAFQPAALNARGQVAGTQGASAAVWENGAVAVLGPGAAADIGDDGRVVGQSGRDAVLWEGGTMTVLWRPVELDSAVALSVNARGEVLIEEYRSWRSCSDCPANRTSRFFLWRDGAVANLDLPGARELGPQGWIVGTQDFGGQRSVGYVDRDGARTNLRPLVDGVGWYTAAFGANARGEVVGFSGIQGPPHAVVWPSPDAEPTPLVPATAAGIASGSWGTAINDAGHVVGNLSTSARGYGFLWRNGRIALLENLQSDAAWQITRASAINDQGQILALGRKGAAGEPEVVLLSPAR